ncbi:MAG TPA: peptidoglycan-binding domain-containing protein [Solirubrobacteraceae bacterium]|jgi:peptidoglycan hydrolase-like protein with peptidoglycan-binding domain|nr:peptidoglycan-binding domain-containing protein [Solirubrobacteraceae bacterium]
MAVGAIALATAAGAALVLLRPGSPSHAPASTGVPAGDTTATLERRTLVERSSVDGTLGYGGSLEIYDRLAGTFTWLPAVGAVIGRGGTLFRLNNEPVALMYGSLPAYRALKLGVSDGPDVRQLDINLVDLGFDPYGAIAENEHFGEATAAAVRRWQKAEGLAQTGEVELGRVVFAPGARRVTVLHVTVGEDPPGSAAGRPAGEQPAPTKPAAKKPAAKKPAVKRPAARRPAARKPAAKVPAARERAPKGAAAGKPASSGPSGSKEKEAAGSNEKPGSGEAAAQPKLTLGTTSTQQIVQLAVKASSQELAHVGETAPVTLPNGDVVRGRVTSVGTVASESSEGEKEKGGGSGGGGGGGGENATIPVTLTLDHRVARLDKAPVSVQLVKAIRRNVLAVPATALVATAGGGFAVEVLEGAHRVALAVTPGMFANGYVEVEGPNIHAGLTVLQSQ